MSSHNNNNTHHGRQRRDGPQQPNNKDINNDDYTSSSTVADKKQEPTTKATASKATRGDVGFNTDSHRPTKRHKALSVAAAAAAEDDDKKPAARDDKQQAENVQPPRAKRGRKKKTKGMPSRPLSAYNMFFREKRLSLLTRLQDVTVKEGQPNKFTQMGKLAAQEWKNVSKEDHERFERLAAKDMERYQLEMEEYRYRQVEQKKHQNQQGLQDNEDAKMLANPTDTGDKKQASVKQPSPYETLMPNQAYQNVNVNVPQDLVQQQMPNANFLDHSHDVNTSVRNLEPPAVQTQTDISKLVNDYLLLSAGGAPAYTPVRQPSPNSTTANDNSYIPIVLGLLLSMNQLNQAPQSLPYHQPSASFASAQQPFSTQDPMQGQNNVNESLLNTLTGLVQQHTRQAEHAPTGTNTANNPVFQSYAQSQVIGSTGQQEQETNYDTVLEALLRQLNESKGA